MATPRKSKVAPVEVAPSTLDLAIASTLDLAPVTIEQAIISTLTPVEQAIINTPVTLSPLEVARKNAVDTLAGGYGATRDYAIALNEVFPQRTEGLIVHWFDVEQNYKDDFSLAVNAEKKMFYNALRAKVTGSKEINPSSYWSRIKTYGKVARLGVDKPEVSEVLADGTEVINEGASGESKERSPQLRYVDELTSLYKFGERKGTELPANLLEVHELVSQALEKCGVQLNMIKT
jgi:hypothetical protein